MNDTSLDVDEVARRGISNLTLVGAAAVLAKLLGVAEKLAIAFYFGTSSSADAYFVVAGVVTSAGSFVRELADPVLLPMFVRRAHVTGPTPARRMMWRFFGWSVVPIALAAVPVLIEPGACLRLLAPGMTLQTLGDQSQLVRCGALAAIFMAGSMVTQTALHGLGRFGVPAFAELAQRAIPVLACIAAGVSGVGTGALGVGLLAAALVRAAFQVIAFMSGAPELPRTGVALAPPRPEPVARFTAMQLLWPLLLGLAFHYLGEAIETRLVSTAGAGAIAARLYAKKVVETPVVLAPYVLSVVGFPYVASLCAQERWQALARLLARVSHRLAVLFVLLALLLGCFAEPTIALLLRHGRFDASAAATTSHLLPIYALGLPLLALEAVLVPVFYAAGNTGTPAWVGAVGVVTNVGAMLVLAPQHGIIGIATANVFAKLVKLALLTACLRRYVGVRANTLLRNVCELLCGGLPAVIAASVLSAALGLEIHRSFALGVRLSIAIIVVCLVFGFCYYVGRRVFGWRSQREHSTQYSSERP